MLEILKEHFLPCLINNMVVIYIISQLLGKFIKIKFIKMIIIFLMTLTIMLNSLIMPTIVRFFTATIITTFFISKIYQMDIKYLFIIVIAEQIILFVSEIIFALIKIFFLKNNLLFIFELPGNIISVLFICLISIFITKLLIKMNIEKHINNINNFIFENFKDYLVISFFLLTLNILLLFVYNSKDNYLTIILNIFFIIIYSFIIYNALKKKGENKILLSNLNEYEKMLDYQRVNNHENKNQLLVIKSMIEKNNDNVIEYIDEIIKEKREDNEFVYNKTKRIPSGGLQGLIYQKMLLMQEKNIEVNLDINSKVRKVDLENLSSKMNYDICRIVGIIIDNAIEETAKFNKKDREIIISMYVDDMFIIEVSNRIKDDLDLIKIYDKGYTSKEKGHGYGLSLLKKIVDENDNIINEVKIVNNIFTQMIKIKM